MTEAPAGSAAPQRSPPRLPHRGGRMALPAAGRDARRSYVELLREAGSTASGTSASILNPPG